MKFLVSRTSEWDKTVQPCDGAVAVSPSMSYFRGQWELELSSLDDLWKFVDEHGDIVLSRGSKGEIDAGETRLHLEIYDDYRE